MLNGFVLKKSNAINGLSSQEEDRMGFFLCKGGFGYFLSSFGGTVFFSVCVVSTNNEDEEKES